MMCMDIFCSTAGGCVQKAARKQHLDTQTISNTQRSKQRYKKTGEAGVNPLCCGERTDRHQYSIYSSTDKCDVGGRGGRRVYCI